MKNRPLPQFPLRARMSTGLAAGMLGMLWPEGETVSDDIIVDVHPVAPADPTQKFFTLTDLIELGRNEAATLRASHRTVEAAVTELWVERLHNWTQQFEFYRERTRAELDAPLTQEGRAA